MGVYEMPPPEGSGLTSVAIAPDDLFWVDRGLVQGAVDLTKYRDRLRRYVSSLVP